MRIVCTIFAIVVGVTLFVVYALTGGEYRTLTDGELAQLRELDTI